MIRRVFKPRIKGISCVNSTINYLLYSGCSEFTLPSDKWACPLYHTLYLHHTIFICLAHSWQLLEEVLQVPQQPSFTIRALLGVKKRNVSAYSHTGSFWSWLAVYKRLVIIMLRALNVNERRPAAEIRWNRQQWLGVITQHDATWLQCKLRSSVSDTGIKATQTDPSTASDLPRPNCKFEIPADVKFLLLCEPDFWFNRHLVNNKRKKPDIFNRSVAKKNQTNNIK